jgi:hypothetical protein
MPARDDDRASLQESAPADAALAYANLSPGDPLPSLFATCAGYARFAFRNWLSPSTA